MASRSDYLARFNDARREAARAMDPQARAAWERIADGWADLLRHAGYPEDDAHRAEPKTLA